MRRGALPLRRAADAQRPASRSPDDELARDFWRCVEQRPPLYGADLQLSLFDEELATG